MSTAKYLQALRRFACVRSSVIGSKWCTARPFHVSCKCCDKTEQADKPFRYMTYKDRSFQSFNTVLAPERPKYQGEVLIFCTFIFFVYFAILREENDLDDALRKMESEPHVIAEEAAIRSSIAINLQSGKDTTDLQNRLRELTEKAKKEKQDSS